MGRLDRGRTTAPQNTDAAASNKILSFAFSMVSGVAGGRFLFHPSNLSSSLNSFPLPFGIGSARATPLVLHMSLDDGDRFPSGPVSLSVESYNIIKK